MGCEWFSCLLGSNRKPHMWCAVLQWLWAFLWLWADLRRRSGLVSPVSYRSAKPHVTHVAPMRLVRVLTFAVTLN